MDVTIVIATMDRAEELRITLEGWRGGTLLPAEVRVVDASDGDETRALCAQDWSPLRVTYLRSALKSAAQQRNLGAAGCATALILFCDDDIEQPPETLARLVQVFVQDEGGQVGGVAGAQVGLRHKTPRRLLRWYYWALAGYDDPTYAGRFFGPAVNITYTDRPEDPELFPSQWLDSCLVLYRAAIFERERFPPFRGYSFQEDVHLSARIGRTHQLYFHRGVRYVHKSAGGTHKADHRRSGAAQLANRWYNATELLQLRGFERAWKFGLSQIMGSVWLIRSRPAGWRERMAGGWGALWQLAVRRRDVRELMEQSP